MSKASLLTATFGKLLVNRPIKLGNTSGPVVSTVPAPVAVSNTSATLTTTQVLSGVIKSTPAAAITLTLPTAAALLNLFPRAVVGDSFQLSVVNLGASSGNNVTIAGGTGMTLVGYAVVLASADGSGSGNFLLRFTNVTQGAAAVEVTRVS